ncbi:hypothetical protein [Asticcacaulis tiandongensis]|uniref:hypothetical protein n=1 Tax=Asticcacaulis tiandongensis TaxID=2565365 RepID=UPI00112A7A00|nr:hypothetical protein [Asticcacaulis tiandongensis]
MVGPDNHEDWQEAILAFTTALGWSVERLTAVRYSGNFSFNVPADFMLTNGKNIGSRLVEAFPFLNQKFPVMPDPLMDVLIESVIRPNPGYMPVTIVDAFGKLLGDRAKTSRA